MIRAVEQTKRDPAGLDRFDQLYGNSHETEADRPAPHAVGDFFFRFV